MGVDMKTIMIIVVHIQMIMKKNIDALIMIMKKMQEDMIMTTIKDINPL